MTVPEYCCARRDVRADAEVFRAIGACELEVACHNDVALEETSRAVASMFSVDFGARALRIELNASNRCEHSRVALAVHAFVLFARAPHAGAGVAAPFDAGGGEGPTYYAAAGAGLIAFAVGNAAIHCDAVACAAFGAGVRDAGADDTATLRATAEDGDAGLAHFAFGTHADAVAALRACLHGDSAIEGGVRGGYGGVVWRQRGGT